MLDRIFMQILDMSGTASIVILVVLLARLILKKAPKVFSYALWGLVLLRLLLPIHMEAEVSMIPVTPSVSESYALEDAPISFAGAGIAAYQAVGDAFNGGLGVQHIPTTQKDAEGNVEYVTADWGDVWILFGQYVWLLGIVVMAVYSLVSYTKLRKRLEVRISLRQNIYIADGIDSPFVIGLIKPKIYLPSDLGEKEQEYIILHEQLHIRRLDHVIKALAFAALVLHWFNPLVWLAFVLASRDMEMSCDEAVIRKLGPEVRADYSASLVALATGRKRIAGTPLAFGEGDTKGRVRNLAKWKKPVLWIAVIAAVACVVLAICLLTDPTGTQQPDQSTEPTAVTTVPQQTQQTESTVPTTEPQPTSPPETTAPAITGPGSDIDFRMGALETKFPFVFDQNDEWLPEYLGQYDYVDVSQLKHGAFYVVDKRDKELRLLFENGVQILRETPNTVFCVMDGNRLIRSDYYGEKVETVYEAAYGAITYAERLDNFMYLLDGEYIVTLDLITYDVLDSYFTENADRLCPYSYTMVWWSQNDDDFFLYDLTIGESQPITEVELNYLTSRMILDPPTTPISDEHPTLTVKLKSAAITLNGTTVRFLVNREQLQTIRELFAAAEKCSESEIPDGTVMGPTLTLSGVDDYVTAGQLAVNTNLFKVGDIWYKYDTGGGDGAEAVSRLLGLFGLEDWPQWVYDALQIKPTEAEPTVPDDFVIPDGIPDVVTYATELDAIPNNYTPEQAAADGCVVLIEGDADKNEDFWFAWTVAYSRGISAKVRFVDFYSTGEIKRAYELIGCGYGDYCFFYRWVEDGSVKEKLHRALYMDYIIKEDGENYLCYKVYALTSEDHPAWPLAEGVPTDDSTWNNNMVLVFCEFTTVLPHPEIPQQLQKATLSYNGEDLGTVWNYDKLAVLREILANADGYVGEPKTVIWGPELTITGTDGKEITMRMMQYSPMVMIDEVFYLYDPGWKNAVRVEDVMELFELTHPYPWEQ